MLIPPRSLALRCAVSFLGFAWLVAATPAQDRAHPPRCLTPPAAAGVGVEGPGDCAYSSTTPASQYMSTFVFRVPVVFHVIQRTNGTGHLSAAQVQSQIDILNEDFRAVAGTPGDPGFDTMIEFYLATTAPNGKATTGITYSTNNTWFNDGGQYYNTLAWDPPTATSTSTATTPPARSATYPACPRPDWSAARATASSCSGARSVAAAATARPTTWGAP